MRGSWRRYCRTRCAASITLGSPFSGDPRHTNAWRLYERKSGHKIDDRESHLGGPLGVPPPVPTTAIFSRSDGICAWQNCVEKESPIAESIEVNASHCGLGHHPAAVFAVADRLAQPEGRWKPFDRDGARAMFFPDPTELEQLSEPPTPRPSSPAAPVASSPPPHPPAAFRRSASRG